ncbi:hypothetical protein V1525DRAFT_395333 [Lipomyces kononenkoae]|uniref:Uncharacterized protein n=1 Tax=Lipomyces kononenkoae TaxID=34357 RepID=A0ACC3T9D4_LIPKO
MHLRHLQLFGNLGHTARLPISTLLFRFGNKDLLLPLIWNRRQHASTPIRIRANDRCQSKPAHLESSMLFDSEQFDMEESDLSSSPLSADLNLQKDHENADEQMNEDELVKDPLGLYEYFQSQAQNALDSSQQPPTSSAAHQLLEVFDPTAVHQFIVDSIDQAKHARDPMSDLWTVLDYMRTENGDESIIVSAKLSMDAFKDIFKISSRLSNGREASRLTRMVGDVFYMANTMRPNSEQHLPPQLDMSYILALADTNSVNNALRLWQARKAELSQEYRWWELGVELYLKKSDVEGALGAARDLLHKFRRISTYTRMILFIKFCEMGNLKLSEEMYHDMVTGFNDMYSKVEDHELKDKMKQNFKRTLVKCARAALDTGNTRLGYAIINEIEELGGKAEGNISLMLMDHLTRSAINSVLDDAQLHHRRARPSPEAIGWLGNVVKQSLADFPEAEKSQEFYRVLLNRFCELRLVDEMVFLFRRMMDVGVKPTTFNVQSLLRVLLDKNRIEDARKILKVMEIVRKHELQGLPIDKLPITPPIAEHYGLFLQYYARRQQRQRSKEIIARMQELEIKPSITVFNAIISDAFHRNDFQKVWSTVLMIQSSASDGVYPDAHTYQLVWRSMDRYLRMRARLYARHTSTKERAEINRKLSGDSDSIPLESMRELLVSMVNNSEWKPSLDVYVYVIRALFFAEDVMAGLCVLEICWRLHRFKLTEEVVTIVIDNLSAIVLNPRQGFNRNIFSPAVERDDFEMPSGALHASDKKAVLKSIIVGDLLHLCLDRENPEDDINWEHLIKLVFLWISKVSFETNLIVYQNDFQSLRKLLGLDDAV